MKRIVLIAGIILGTFAAIYYFRAARITPPATGNAQADTNVTAVAEKTVVSSSSDQPSPLVIPAEAARRLAAEQRWASGNNGPVVFYAKIVDQNGRPVQGATLTLNFSIFDEGVFVSDKDRVKTSKLQIVSDAQGLLEVKRDKGSSLWVETLEKEGYAWSYPPGLGSFDFASMSRPKQQPDYVNPTKRMVFHVWKKGETEPIIQSMVRVGLKSEQEVYFVNLVTGKKVGADDPYDLVIRIPLVTDPIGAARGDRLFIFEIPQGGIIETTDAYPYFAPNSGYQPEWKWLHETGESRRDANSWRKTFYLRARNGRVYFGLNVAWGIGATAFEISAVANPAGTRNLEPDPEKLITDPEEIRRLDVESRRR